MLIVISIISVLLGLLYGSLERARKFSRRAIAYTEVKNVEAALKQYYAHYHDWPYSVDTFINSISQPLPGTGGDGGFIIDKNAADMLQGTLTDSSAQGLRDANPDRIPFVEFARFTKEAGENVPVNPFRITSGTARSRQYKVLFDLDNDSKIEVTDDDAVNFSTNVYRSIAVWTVIPGTSTSDNSGAETAHDEVLGSWDNFDAK
jgi:type II secretory pathway pseudopilin PulG